jgi:hypothetical protein
MVLMKVGGVASVLKLDGQFCGSCRPLWVAAIKV